ncbi:aminoacyl-tRNA hydrolase [Acidobacteriota bacterium]
MWAVIGLGNPGRQYLRTRHNVGFLFVKRVAKSWEIKLRKRSCLSKIALTEHMGEKILLVLPQTYMNNSGQAVKCVLESRGITLDHLLVVYDDLDIPLGEIRIRTSGSSGTHNGMSSIVQEIQTTQFPRIRVGIGPLSPDETATDFVLSPFEGKDVSLLNTSLTAAQKALDLILNGDIEKAMNQFN